MAKKVEYSVEEKLRAMYDLQLIDSRIDKIRSIRGELPLEVEDLEDEIEGLNFRINNKIIENPLGHECDKLGILLLNIYSTYNLFEDLNFPLKISSENSKTCFLFLHIVTPLPAANPSAFITTGNFDFSKNLKT